MKSMFYSCHTNISAVVILQLTITAFVLWFVFVCSLHVAAARGQTDCLSVILAHGADLSITDAAGMCLCICVFRNNRTCDRCFKSYLLLHKFDFINNYCKYKVEWIVVGMVSGYLSGFGTYFLETDFPFRCFLKAFVFFILSNLSLNSLV